MRRGVFVFSIVISAMLCAPAYAQTPAAPGAPRQPDPGVSPTTIMDGLEVRILRVEVQPGAVRRSHVHNDVAFHLFVPVNGKMQVTMDGDKTVDVAPGEVQFFKVNTLHGFKNPNATPVTVIEVFVKPTAKAADLDAFAAAVKMLVK